jgi:hypothetical protein
MNYDQLQNHGIPDHFIQSYEQRKVIEHKYHVSFYLSFNSSLIALQVSAKLSFQQEMLCIIFASSFHSINQSSSSETNLLSSNLFVPIQLILIAIS